MYYNMVSITLHVGMPFSFLLCTFVLSQNEIPVQLAVRKGKKTWHTYFFEFLANKWQVSPLHFPFTSHVNFSYIIIFSTKAESCSLWLARGLASCICHRRKRWMLAESHWCLSQHMPDGITLLSPFFTRVC